MKTLSQKKLRALLIALTALLLALAAVLGITSFKNGGETETASAYTYSDIAIIKLTFYNDTSWVKTIYNFNGDNLISQSSSNTSQSANGYGFNFKWYSANPASNPYTEWMYYGSSNFYWGPYQFDAYVACIKSGSSYLLPYIVINSSGEYRKSGVATVTSGGTVNASSIGATSSSTQYMYIPAGSSSNAKTLNYAIDSSYRVYTNSSSVTGTTLYLTGSGVTTDSTSSSIVHNYTAVSTTAESAVTTYVSSAYSATYTGSTITHPLYSSYSSTFTFSGTTSNAAAGSYSFTVTPKTGYRWSDGTTDSKTVSWTVAQASVSSATVTLGTGSYTYDGTAKTPTVTVKVGSTTLTSGTDYTVSYSNNTNAGTATVTVTGTGNYTGTATATYTISKASVTAPTAVTGLTYTGTSQTGVASGSNYTLSGTYYATAAGSYTATAALSSSNYQWSDGTTADKSISWTIAQASISSATVTLGTTSYTYDGSAKTPTVEGNYLIFTTVHFSEFVVLGEKDTNLTWLVVVLAVLLAGEIAALAALVILKKKKNGSGSVNASAFVPAGLLAAVVPSGAVPASIVLGVFVVLAAGAIVYVCLRKNKKNTQDSELEEQEASEEAEGLAASESASEAELAAAAYAAETAAAGVGAAEEPEGEAVSGEPKGAVLPTAAPYGGYNKSYLAKLIQSDGGTKGCYAALKDEVLSYGCKSRTSWRAESFRIGRKVVLKFVMRGKTFCLCWEGDASAYAGSKYKVEELRARKSGGKNLIVYRMKNARRLRYAKELLAEILGTYGLVRSDIREHCVPPAYEDTEALLEKGLIKKVKTAESGAQGAQPHLPVQPKDHVSVAEADDLMSNEEAETFIEEDTLRYADKTKTGIVNVDTLARYFESGEKITLEDIKKRVPDFNGKVTYVKVLARGTLSKAFTVEADDFSLKAVKMIVLTGGKVIRTRKKDE